MSRPSPRNNCRLRQAKQRNALARARGSRRGEPLSKRGRGLNLCECQPYAPPEDWYEPSEEPTDGYEFVVQDPGEGYRHILTPDEIRDRLAELPEQFTDPIEIVQLSQMTRKKQTFPCYGMQWGATLYLYPLEESLVECFYQPPKPALVNETKMYGARWTKEEPGVWKLEWTERAAKNYYLNNILIHELGHLLDERNTSYLDRERYAEWFAIQHGYQPTRTTARKPRRVVRRHHSA